MEAEREKRRTPRRMNVTTAIEEGLLHQVRVFCVINRVKYGSFFEAALRAELEKREAA